MAWTDGRNDGRTGGQTGSQKDGMSFIMRRPSTISLVATMSIALVVADAAMAQTQVQGNRVTTNIVGSRAGNQPKGMNRPGQFLSGKGQGLGDGNSMGGQTFDWARSVGQSQVLGSGNSLDANSQVGSGGANSGSVPVDYAARNLLVTGSVPGGRGFRGSVGYTADTDFRASTGSDASYLFRAGSAFSNPAFATSAVARDRFLIAQGLGVFEFRRESTPVGVDFMRTVNDQPESRLRLDRANAQMAIGRSNWDIGADRTIATSQTAKGEPLRYVISPLRGLQIENLTDPMARGGMSVYERARARLDISMGLATADDYARVREGMSMDTPDPRRVDRRVSGSSAADRTKVEGNRMLPKSYLDIVDAVNQAAKPGDKPTDAPGTNPKPLDPNPTDAKPSDTRPSDVTDTPKTPLEQIRQAVEGLRGSRGGADRPSTGTKPSDSLVSADGTPRSGEAEREAERVRQRGVAISVEDAARMLRHGKTVESLGRDDRRRVDELVQQGENALREGDYFRAERRFEQAQALAAENPLAEAGIAHAQLGAGLYLSAALTLRNLFVAFPELIDAKYDRALLPAPDRLDKAVQVMRDRIVRGDDAPSYGLMLAYIGHQTGDRKMVEEGLALMTGSEKLETARKLIEGVWLGTK